MKYILILSLFCSIAARAQDTMKVVQSDVSFQFAYDTSYDEGDAITFSYKTAKFKHFFLNQEDRFISVVWLITDSTFKFKSGSLQSTQPSYEAVQKAVDQIYILPDGATAAWTTAELLMKYGTLDTTGNWQKTPSGSYILTRGDIMDGWSFYQLKAVQPIPITMLFKAAGLRAAAEGRLNRPAN